RRGAVHLRGLRPLAVRVQAGGGAAARTARAEPLGVDAGVGARRARALSVLRLCPHARRLRVPPATGHVPRDVPRRAMASMEARLRLTQLAKRAGCAAKHPPGYLFPLLAGLPAPSDPNVIVGSATADDAAVYR